MGLFWWHPAELVPDGSGHRAEPAQVPGGWHSGADEGCHAYALLSRCWVLEATLTVCLSPCRVHAHWDVNISFRETSCR